MLCLIDWYKKCLGMSGVKDGHCPILIRSILTCGDRLPYLS